MAERVTCVCCGKSVPKGYSRCFKLDGSFKDVCYDCYTKNGYLQKGYEEREEKPINVHNNINQLRNHTPKEPRVICACCGKSVPKGYSRCFKLDGSFKDVCYDCYTKNNYIAKGYEQRDERFCHICQKNNATGDLTLIKFLDDDVCEDCVKQALDFCGKCILNFLDYIKDFYNREKWQRCCSEIKELKIEKYLEKHSKFKNLMIKYISEKNLYTSYTKNYIFDIAVELIGKRLDTTYDCLLSHWNDFLAENKDIGLYAGDFIVGDACNRCGLGRKIFYSYSGSRGHNFSIKTGKEKIYDSAYNLYVRIQNDQDYKCPHYIAWLDIIGELRKKFGWNPKWKVVLNEFEEFGVRKRSDFKADPSDLYKILKKNGIVMSQQIVDAWNDIYYRRDGDCIVQCYAVPDSTRGQIEQGINRATGGLLKKLFG